MRARDIAGARAYRSGSQQIGTRMALFKASPEKQLTTAITARDKLCTRLTDTEAAVIDLRSAAERLALDGASDEMLSTAEGKTRAMLDRAETLRAALAQATAHVARIEHEQAQADDAAHREETAAKVELLAREVIEAANAVAAAGAALAECATKAVVAAPEAGGVHAFALACREIPAAGELIAKLLRVHSAAGLAGTAPPLLAKPPESYVAPVGAKPALTQVFALHALRGADEHGMGRQIGKWRDVSLPPCAPFRSMRLAPF